MLVPHSQHRSPEHSLISSGMKTNRRRFFQQTAALLPLLSAWPVRAGQAAPALRFDPLADVIPAPDDPAHWPEFRSALAQWRKDTRARLNYNFTSQPATVANRAISHCLPLHRRHTPAYIGTCNGVVMVL